VVFILRTVYTYFVLTAVLVSVQVNYNPPKVFSVSLGSFVLGQEVMQMVALRRFVCCCFVHEERRILTLGKVVHDLEQKEAQPHPKADEAGQEDSSLNMKGAVQSRAPLTANNLSIAMHIPVDLLPEHVQKQQSENSSPGKSPQRLIGGMLCLRVGKTASIDSNFSFIGHEDGLEDESQLVQELRGQTIELSRAPEQDCMESRR